MADTGYLYVDLGDDGVGTIKGYSQKQMKFMVDQYIEVEVDIAIVKAFQDHSKNWMNYGVSFDANGVGTVFELPEETPVDINPKMVPIRKLPDSVDDAIIMTIADNKAVLTVQNMEFLDDYKETSINIYVTDFANPNVIRFQKVVAVSALLTSNVVVHNIPDGTPKANYSLWSVVPNTCITVYWTM